MPTTNPVPSTDPSDLLFNAGKLDEVVNGTANSFTDRLGIARRTVAGMNADFDAQLADAESDLNVYRADAAASAAEALGYLQTIRATSYGAYASDPATDPLGNPPTVGDEYFNTTSNLLKRWNGTTWQASDINTANLAAPSGSSLVGYQPDAVGSIATTVEDDLNRMSINIKRFGADPSNTDEENAAAFALAAAEASRTECELVFSAGVYSYSGGLEFTKPVTLRGEGATLNYTGTGKAIKLGPDSLTVSTRQNGLYEVHGLRITGGASMTDGIYINEFVVYSSIHNNYFINFGNASSFAVFFQSSNWRCEVTNNNYVLTDGVARNFLRVRGRGVTSGTDYGQSKLLMVGNNISNVAASGGIGCWISGVASIATCNKIEGFAPNIRVGATATFAQVVNNYFENAVNSTTGAVEFGDPAGGDSPSAYTIGLRVVGNYCNTHNSDPTFYSTSKLLAPSGSSAGLQDSFVSENTLTQITAGTEIVKLNNLSSQLRNVAHNNRCYSGGFPVAFINNTIGASIANWVGAKLDNPIESNVVRDSLVQHVLQGGKTAHQYVQLLFKSFNGSEMGVLQGFNGQDMGLNATNDLYVTADSRVWVGKTGKQIGFFGASPQSKPTVSGSRGGNAALGSLITALANLGLLTDSTTA